MPLSYSSCSKSVENQELRKALKDLKLRLNACFIADVSDFIDQSDLSLLPRLEAIGCRWELSGFYHASCVAGFDRLSGRLTCWLEILVSDMEWIKLDLNAKSLGYKPEWVRLVHASTAALLNMLEKTIGS